MKTRLLKRLRRQARSYYRIEPNTDTSCQGYWIHEWDDGYELFDRCSDPGFCPTLETAIIAYNRKVKEKFISLANKVLYKRHIKYIEHKTKGRMIWDTPVKIS